MRGQKHLVACRCVLPQYKSRKDPYIHKFIVFSTIKEDDSVVAKYAQCNNCGVIHRITGVCTSEIMSGKEHMPSLMSIDEVKTSIPKNIANILEANSADLSTWEAVQFIIENKKWGEFANRFPASAARIPIILPTKGNWLRSEIDQYFAAHSVQPQIIAEIQDPELQRQLALSGAGATALAQLSIESELKSGELIQFDAKPFCYERIWLVSAYRRHENPVASALMKNFKLESTSRIEAP